MFFYDVCDRHLRLSKIAARLNVDHMLANNQQRVANLNENVGS